VIRDNSNFGKLFREGIRLRCLLIERHYGRSQEGYIQDFEGLRLILEGIIMTLATHPIERVIEHRGVDIPTFLYGTAWKENETEALTRMALNSGFLGIDTANQRRHYYEAGVGEAVRQVLAEGRLRRSDLFLQSKFTFASGQDHRIPYDPLAEYSVQVEQSFQGTLEHLKIDYLDSYILHAPATTLGLSKADWEVWRAMESLQKSGAVRLIGVSNIEIDQLKALVEGAEVKPAFVQNRCYAYTCWDYEIRRICKAHDILYQGFSLLTANALELTRPEIQAIAKRMGCPLTRIVFRFALQSGMIPLTGTSDPGHMADDLAAYDMELDKADMETIEQIAFTKPLSRPY
jgi:diketogulonate reductase-like aldo/keto reductase